MSCDVVLVASLAAGAVLMKPLPLSVIAVLTTATLVFVRCADKLEVSELVGLPHVIMRGDAPKSVEHLL